MMAHRLKYFSPLVVWMAVIYYVSSIPGDEIPKFELWSADKLAHLAVFSVLSLSAWLAFDHYGRSRGHSVRWIMGLSIAWCIVYAASDEIHQYYVPNRSCEWSDLAADVIGIAFTHGLLMWTRNRKGNTEVHVPS
jgi:VanZ family protein